MRNEIKLGNVMVDCDDELKLQRFYGELLGWEMCNLFDRPAVCSSETSSYGFQRIFWGIDL